MNVKGNERKHPKIILVNKIKWSSGQKKLQRIQCDKVQKCLNGIWKLNDTIKLFTINHVGLFCAYAIKWFNSWCKIFKVDIWCLFNSLHESYRLAYQIWIMQYYFRLFYSYNLISKNNKLEWVLFTRQTLPNVHFQWFLIIHISSVWHYFSYFIC